MAKYSECEMYNEVHQPDACLLVQVACQVISAKACNTFSKDVLIQSKNHN